MKISAISLSKNLSFSQNLVLNEAALSAALINNKKKVNSLIKKGAPPYYVLLHGTMNASITAVKLAIPLVTPQLFDNFAFEHITGLHAKEIDELYFDHFDIPEECINTLLLYSIMSNNDELSHFLITEKKANVFYNNHRSLLIAKRDKNIHGILFLLDHYDYATLTNKRQVDNCIEHAARNNILPVIKRLFNVVDASTSNLAITIAIGNEYMDTLKYMLSLRTKEQIESIPGIAHSIYSENMARYLMSRYNDIVISYMKEHILKCIFCPPGAAIIAASPKIKPKHAKTLVKRHIASSKKTILTLVKESPAHLTPFYQEEMMANFR